MHPAIIRQHVTAKIDTGLKSNLENHNKGLVFTYLSHNIAHTQTRGQARTEGGAFDA